MDINQIIRAYVKIRDAKLEAKKIFDAADAELKAKLDRLNSAMLQFLQENNTESMRTDSGTVYKQEEIIPRGGDWDAFYTWVKANDAFDALERRIKKTFIKEYMDIAHGFFGGEEPRFCNGVLDALARALRAEEF